MKPLVERFLRGLRVDMILFAKEILIKSSLCLYKDSLFLSSFPRKLLIIFNFFWFCQVRAFPSSKCCPIPVQFLYPTVSYDMM